MAASSIPSHLRLLILDLDGTLIDSTADLAQSVNAVLDHLGRPRLPQEQIARYVGNGAAALVRRALGLLPIADPEGVSETPAAPLAPAEEELAQTALAFFLDYYRQHKLDDTRLYPGVESGLRQLQLAGYEMAVLTNKPVIPSREIIAGLGVAGYFGAVYGGNSFAQKKPDPIGIQSLLGEFGVDPRDAVMIGDSAIDVRCGRAAGTWTAGVTYGFAPRSLQHEPPDWISDRFDDLARNFAHAKTCAEMAE